MFAFYRALTALRQSEPALMVGDYRSVDAGADEICAYVRAMEGSDDFLIVLNFGADGHRIDLSALSFDVTIALSSEMTRRGMVDLENLIVSPNEGLILRLS